MWLDKIQQDRITISSNQIISNILISNRKNWILGFYAVDFKFNLSVGLFCVIVAIIFER